MEALRVMTYFKVSLSTCNWDSAKEKALSYDKAFLGEFGRCERIRTSDPLHPMQMRYLAALHTDGVSSADGEEVYGDAPTLSTGEIPVRDRLPALRATSDQSATSRAFCRHLSTVLHEKRPPWWAAVWRE